MTTKLVLTTLGLLATAGMAFAADAKVEKAIDKGLDYLEGAQQEGGYWSTEDFPGLTGLVVQSFLLAPGKPDGDGAVDKGLEFIRKSAKDDGGIYNKGMSNYNTSIALATLLHAGKEGDEALIEKARAFLIGGQKTDDGRNSGGFGYEPEGQRSRPDLDNTVFALEALALYREKNEGEKLDDNKPKLNWEAAIEFVENCQNLPSSNDTDWADDSEKERGGFTYSPGGGENGTHSYGSMTYSGLLSLVHARVDKEDPRVKAAVEWLAKYFSVEENPGQGEQGIYYYYFVMAKALEASGLDTLPTTDGKDIDWRKELTAKLLDLQRKDGSWVNENGRWMERDPVLVTAYAVLALAYLEKGA